MAFYQAVITKSSSVFNESWSNVYEVNGLDIFNALEVATNIAAAEKAVSYNTVTFDKIVVRDESDHSHSRTSTGFGPGELSPTGLGGPLPLFCCVRVVFSSLEGKPEQKYLRLGANEANLSLGRWDGEFVSYVASNYGDILQAMSEYVGPSGEAHINSQVQALVQNRQLGWHRRSRPGFRRGWVAV